VYGVPGFETSEDQEEFDFEHLSEDEALEISDVWFNTAADAAERLDTERDDSFRLQTTHGDRVLKVAHPADTSAFIDRQLRAVEHARRADRSLPLQRIFKTPGGGLWLGLPSGRVARMLEWIPGDLLLDVPTGATELAALGDALGRLTKALSTFADDGDERPSAWDLQTVPRLATLLAAFPSDTVGEAIGRYNEHVLPRIVELPLQVIHNDFNPGNVLVDANDPRFVVGILDFGDVVQSFRVADLAVALSYQLYPLRHNWMDVAPMIEAFDGHVRLTEAERSVLPDLVAARFAQRILINSWTAQSENESYDEYDTVVATLAALLNLET
jgi:Ser/Thr protein kinase RdoA (MazF antagonist)